MAKYQLLFTKDAQRDIKKLDTVTRQRIAKKLLFYLDQADPLLHARELVHSSIGGYRFRVGHYRLVFDVHGKQLVILNVKHRKDIYKTK